MVESRSLADVGGGGLVFQELLSPNGCFFMVAVEDNDPTEIIAIMQGFGVHAEVRVVGSI